MVDGVSVPLRLPLDTHPRRYLHWKLDVDGPIATLIMHVQAGGSTAEPGDYALKLNSYDLSVDIELNDAIQRIRFEHPAVRALVVTSGQDHVFSAGANIYMLGRSTHTFKVNFCKYTNETRLALEDLADASEVATIAACNGAASGGGYELALACNEIYLVDDGRSTVSFPEAPQLAVLPGTGGLTRLVDKRGVRRDLADVFSTVAEGVRGRRAERWKLVDHVVPRSKWTETIGRAAAQAAQARPERGTVGIELGPVDAKPTDDGYRYDFVHVRTFDHHAELQIRGPDGPQPQTGEAFVAAGDRAWALRAFRELDDALVRLRFEFPRTGLLVLRTQGDLEAVQAADHGLLAAQGHWLGREILLHMKRVLKRLDVTARSLFCVIDESACFGGSLLEVALAADRTYMLDDPDRPAYLAANALNKGRLPMANGLSRLRTRFIGSPDLVDKIFCHDGPIDTHAANDLGLATFTPDDIDWDDEIRIAIEERAKFSPDAMTAMEANLRFAGPETMETKIFGRLSAWQNWIFQRPNAVGEQGALTLYGKQSNPVFDPTRT